MISLLAAGLAGVAALLFLRGAGPNRSGGRGVVGRVQVRLPSRRHADETADSVLEACDALAAELSAGRPPGEALDSAAMVWQPLGAVAQAHRLGADVALALRRVAAEHEGAGDLRLVAGAWEVAHFSGHGLARALTRTSRGIRARRRTKRVVESELSSARTTARLVCLLPGLVLLGGSGAAERPWLFLVSNPIGWGCLITGLALIAAGLAWIEAIARRAVAP